MSTVCRGALASVVTEQRRHTTEEEAAGGGAQEHVARRDSARDKSQRDGRPVRNARSLRCSHAATHTDDGVYTDTDMNKQRHTHTLRPTASVETKQLPAGGSH